MPIIPARKSVAFAVRAGEDIKIINTHGKQVLDFWAFNPNDSNDFLSMVHTRTILLKVVISPGDKLYSTRRKPMLTLAEDTTRGTHDLIWSACDTERYRMQGFDGYHDNCTDNMHKVSQTLNPVPSGEDKNCTDSPAFILQALKDSFPDFRIADDWVPDPLNLFMNIPIDHRGGLDIRPPTSEKGQYVNLKAETDLILVISSCPQDLAPVNAGMPTDCEYQVLSKGGAASGEQDTAVALTVAPVLAPVPTGPKRVKIALSVDFDAVSHWLGTGCHKDNNMADYSSGIFAGQVGVYRLLDMFKKNNIADKVTWFIPGHTTDTFPDAAKAVFESGAEIGLHGYAHEGIYQMTEEQERDVLLKWYVVFPP